jgi:hypothetical protein
MGEEQLKFNEHFPEIVNSVATGVLDAAGHVTRPVSDFMAEGILPGAVTGILGLTGVTGLGTYLRNALGGGTEREKRDRWLRNMLLAGGVGALGGGYAGHLLSKSGSFHKRGMFRTRGDAKQEIKDKIMEDYALSYTERERLSRQVNRLTQHQSFELADALKVAGGVGAGYLVAKHLADAGIVGKIVMSLLGGLAGYGLSTPYNDASLDFNNQPLF